MPTNFHKIPSLKNTCTKDFKVFLTSGKFEMTEVPRMFHLSRVAKGVISFTSSAYISKILGVSPSEAAVDLLNPHVVVSLTGLFLLLFSSILRQVLLLFAFDLFWFDSYTFFLLYLSFQGNKILRLWTKIFSMVQETVWYEIGVLDLVIDAVQIGHNALFMIYCSINFGTCFMSFFDLFWSLETHE